jgi:hypothetical protein
VVLFAWWYLVLVLALAEKSDSKLFILIKIDKRIKERDSLAEKVLMASMDDE